MLTTPCPKRRSDASLRETALAHKKTTAGVAVVESCGKATLFISSLYWNASNIYQEGGWHYEPFHGGFGLMTVNYPPKAFAHAFRLLHQHTGQVIASNWADPVEGVGCLATREGDIIRLLLWNYTEPDSDPVPVSIKLTHLPVTNATAESILSERGSAYETWPKHRSPQFTNRDLPVKLENASKPLISKVDIGNL